MTIEKWKQYKDTNYQVSSLGRVYNTKTKRILKGTYKRNEYHSVQLSINGKTKTVMTHRLVAEMFCENPNNYNIVDHIDRDKHNNRSDNLRWVSESENCQNIEERNQAKEFEFLDDLSDFEFIDGTDGKYMISKDGVVVLKSTHRILKQEDRNGYKRVVLNSVKHSVHLLVWQTFKGEIPKGMVIDHIDGNRGNNKLENLRMVSQSENVRNAYLNGHSASKPIWQYAKDGTFIKEYTTIVEAAKAVNCTAVAISSAEKRKGSCAGYFWITPCSDAQKTISEIIEKNKVRKDAIGVIRYDADKTNPKHYYSVREAAADIGCPNTTISRGIREKRKAKGYYWIPENASYTIDDL